MTRIGRWIAAAAALVVAVGLWGCTSTIEINSQPQGADVYLDDKHIGQTPMEYTDSATVLVGRLLVVEHEGYYPVRTVLRRDGDINNTALILGIVGLAAWPLLPAWLWVLDYPQSLEWELTSLEDNSEYKTASTVVRNGDSIKAVLQPVIDIDIIDQRWSVPATDRGVAPSSATRTSGEP